MVKNPPANAGDAGDTGSVPGSGRSPGVGNGNLFQYSCLENFMDRGALQSMGSQKVGHDWVYTHTHTHKCPEEVLYSPSWLHCPSPASDAGSVTILISKPQPSLPPWATQRVLGNPSRGKCVQITERLANGYVFARVVPPLPLPTLLSLKASPEGSQGSRDYASLPVTRHLCYLPDSQSRLSWRALRLPGWNTAKSPHNHFQTLKWPHCHYSREIEFVSSKRSVTGDSIGQCQARRQED